MSATNVNNANRKTTAKKKPSGANSGSKDDVMSAIRLRLFEPKRTSKEYELDVHIVGLVENYEEYLTEKFEQKPLSNKVVEMLLEHSLQSNTDFQMWLRDKSNRIPSPVLDEDELLDNLGKSKTQVV